MKYLAVLLLIPSLLSAKYIDTRDLTEQIKQVNRLMGAKKAQSGSEGAEAAASAVMAVGLGVAIAGAVSGPRYYYRSGYGYGGYYRSYNPAVAVGSALMVAGAAASASAAQSRRQVSGDNASIEQQIIDIISSLVYTDEDYTREIKAFNYNVSNESIIITERINREANTALAAMEQRSNQFEESIKAQLDNVEKAQGISQLRQGLTSLSNQWLGIESSAKDRAQLKKEMSATGKSLAKAKKIAKKEASSILKQTSKQRKQIAEEYEQKQPEILARRQETYNVFANQMQVKAEELFRNYYKAYYAKLL